MRNLIRSARTILEEYSGDGVMLALWPEPSLAEKLAGLGAEDAGDMHMTLGFLGSAQDLDPDALVQARTVLAKIANRWPPLTGVISGFGRFSASKTSDGKDVIYASPDLPELPDFREAVLREIRALGLEPKRDHGYTPHMTLSYVPVGAPNPMRRLEQLPAKFPWVGIAIGGKQHKYRLKGKEKEKE